jgi:hypothetical protein
MSAFRKYFLLFSFFFFHIIFPQTPQVITISPGFNEIASSRHPEIYAAFNVSIDSSSFDEISFAVFAERSGYHSGIISYDNGTKTVSFYSNEQFNAGERVTVMLSNKIKSQQGDSLIGFSWVFRIPSGIAPVNFYEAVPYGGGGYFMQCVDMNNDNFPDIVTSSGTILINNGNGVFVNSWFIPDVDAYQPIIVDDFNRDGYMDVFYYGFDGLKIGLGDGAGNFVITTKPYWFYKYVSSDFNGDGYPDIAGINLVTYIPPDSTTLDFSIAFNDGNGNFIDTCMYKIGGGGMPQNILTTDIDNDGDNDVVIGSVPLLNPYGTFGIDGIIVGKNNGSGNFEEFELYPSDDFYFQVSCALWAYASDFNNDSFNDIAVMGCFAGIVALNTGSGTFSYDEANNRLFWTAELSAPISGGDLNGDSWIDIVVSGYKWPPELQIPHYAIILNNNSYFPGFGNEWNDTLPTGYIYATEVVDINNDSRQDIIHCGEGVYITLSSDTTSSVGNNKNNVFDFHLSQNFPNPFNSLTSMNLESNENGIIRISVYNILGEEVRLLEDKSFTKGNHILEWDGKSEEMLDLPSGIYIIQAKSKEHIQQIKVLLLK